MDNNYDYLEIMQIVCDDFCKYRDELSQEELDEKCENCSLVKKINSKLN